MEPNMGVTAAVSTPPGSSQATATGMSPIYEIAQSNLPLKGVPNKDVGRGEVQGYGPDGKTVFKVQLIERQYNDGLGTSRFYANGKALPAKIITAAAARDEVRRQMKTMSLGPLALGNQNAFAKPSKSTTAGATTSKPNGTAAPNSTANTTASTKPGVRWDAAAIYSVSGALASYNINKQTGMTRGQALATLPAGFARDLITIALSQFPIDVNEPKLEVAIKGGIGGVLTIATNTIAGKVKSDAWPGHSLNAGMVVAAFTVNGNLVGLRELRANGYLGGKPADNPKDWGQWFNKYAPEAVAISTGVSTAITPAVAFKEFVQNRNIGTAAAKWATVGKTGLATLILPMLQYLIANAFVNGPKDGKAAKPNPLQTALSNVASNISNVGAMVSVDKLASMIKSAPAAGTVNPKFSLGKSTGAAALTLGVVHIVDTFAAQESLRNKSIKDIGSAREALATIDKLRGDWYSQGKSALYGDGYMTHLDQMRKLIYEVHPSLKPTGP
jgi:hypothetical protein